MRIFLLGLVYELHVIDIFLMKQRIYYEGNSLAV